MRKLFSADTVRWFSSTLGEPTAVQRAAWPAIAAGEHVLVSAPTGTGKTLAAFLLLIDRMKAEAARGALEDGVRVLYISPLKSLASDIRENLTRPLEGIGGPELRVGVRTGDTPGAERQRMLRRPPHIFITTPESLYILLTTARGRAMLSTVRTVVIDELHALISEKRGAHLMLSLARLDALCPRPAQRIGLSATIRPLELAADYLAPGEFVRVVAPEMEKRSDIAVTGVLPDLRALPQGTIWPELAQKVADCCAGKRTVIAFLEGRAQAERLAAAVNGIMGEGFALTHHGSVSREKRQAAEAALRSGQLRLLCATSSMELGIDVGEVDLVLQVGCPLTVSGALQRLGRAGHNPGRTSAMQIFPKTASDGLWCGLTADAALAGAIEPAHPPRGCLDVLAQHLVSMAADGGYTVDEAVTLFRRAWPTKDLARQDVTGLLEMLSGDWEHAQDRPVRPRLLYDRIHGTVLGDRYTRLLALSAGGTIPDRGLYPAVLQNGTRVGELDEEFVFEARVGDRFLLGAFAWRIDEITRDRVVVSATGGAGAQPPFWRGDGAGRDYGVSLRFGEKLRALQRARDAETALMDLRMDESAARNAARHLREQLAATGCLPDDRTILLEHFQDEAGDRQLMVHSIFGRRVNDALALLMQQAASETMQIDVKAWDDDNGLMLYAVGTKPFPEGLLQGLDPARAEALLTAMLPATPLFGMAFRYNAGRALMMGARSGRRQALWVQRIRGAEALGMAVNDPKHPLMRETLRECLEDRLDLEALTEVLERVRAGQIAVRELHVDSPSPMALPMRRAAEAELMYDYAPIPKAANRAAEDALEQALKAGAGIAPNRELLRAENMRRRAPEDAEQLHSLLMTEGDIAAGEVDAPIDWLESLHRAGRCLYIEPGLWIAAEQAEDYRRASEGDADARFAIARRCLRHRGPQDGESLRERYGWPEEDCTALLARLCEHGAAVEEDGLYYHAELYARAQRQTVLSRRRAVATLPPERYAALLARGLRRPGRPADQLREAIALLLDRPFPLKQWEEQLLPARVSGYRPAMLDALIAQGESFWRLEDGSLSFHRAEDIDWEAPPLTEAALEAFGDEEARAVLRALERRGACFAAALSGLARRRPVVEILLELAGKGLVRADSFVPLRILAALEEGKRPAPRRVAQARASAMQAGRWELVRPLRDRADEELLAMDFAERRLICRESALRVPWFRALETLRVWEYTGRARRGYFVAGISGIQFIREEDYGAVTAGLNALEGEPLWLHAVDPAQAWGRVLPHIEGRSFLCVPGCAVCLVEGRPVAALEQGGRRLRVFEPACAPAALSALARDYRQGFVFYGKERLTIREGAEGFADALARAGWMREALDWVIWKDS